MDGKNPASRGFVDCDSDLIPARPVRDIGIRANAPNVFFVRDNLKVVRIDASPISAQMVKLRAIWDRAVKLFPKPDVAEGKFSSLMDARISIGAWRTNQPTSGFRIRLRNPTPGMAGVIHPRLPGDVSQPGVPGNRRIFFAPAEAATGSADSLGGDFVMAFQKTDKAYSSFTAPLRGWLQGWYLSSQPVRFPLAPGSVLSHNRIMLTLEALRAERRDEILRLAERRGAHSLRVFGSVARGEADENSDLDLLVAWAPGRSLLDHAGLVQDLQELLGIKVHVGTEKSLHWYVRDRILREATPL